MLGFKKSPYDPIACKSTKSEPRSGKVLNIRELDILDLIKRATASEHCTRIAFGNIYQRAGTMLDDSNPEDQGYSVRWDKLTGSLGLSLRIGHMRQTITLSTKAHALLLADLGLSLSASAAATIDGADDKPRIFAEK